MGLIIMRKWVSLSLLVAILFFIEPALVGAQQTSNRRPFKIALLPILDALPYYVAEARGGWPVVIIGAASIIAALAYSGGPYPLASHALGDLFVFIFFGLVAVCGTYYVQALRLTPLAPVMGAMVGLMITAILD